MNTNYGEIPLRNCGTVKNFNLFKEKTNKGDQKRDENQKGPIYQRSHGSKIVQRHLIWRVVSDFVRFSSIGFSFFLVLSLYNVMPYSEFSFLGLVKYRFLRKLFFFFGTLGSYFLTNKYNTKKKSKEMVATSGECNSNF